ncbi:MAG TPA: crossover junction endodeoxyribonuclease RuvC [Solirubrobacterales bacterium]|nr:crossover junction endodeoxyribonuclease RuvC [Solirubrobacterales bacterium]
MALVLGIDPGLASTGYALLGDDGRVAACGTFKTAPGPSGRRLLEIVRGIESLLKGHPVREAALEELFMGQNRTSFLGVAQARGAILACLESAGVIVAEYKPSLVKSVVSGYGGADKRQMARMLGVQVTVGRPADDHALDAIAIGLCHLRSRRLRSIAQ